MSSTILIMLLLASLRHSVQTLGVVEETDENEFRGPGEVGKRVLFKDPNDIDLTLEVKDVKEGTSKKVSLSLTNRTLQETGYTLDQIRRGWIEVSPSGEQTLVIDGERVDVGLASNTVVLLQNVNGSSVALDLNSFANRGMDDVRDDPTLVPEEAPDIAWTPLASCSPENLSVYVTGSSVDMEIDGKRVIHHALNTEGLQRKPVHVPQEGIVLGVINPRTCAPVMDVVTYTADVGGYHDLQWGLRSILPGRVVLVASLRDGATFIGEETRRILLDEGTTWVPYYLFRDSWTLVFIKGGKVLYDGLAPNLGGLNSTGNPVSVHLDARRRVSDAPENAATRGEELSSGYVPDCPAWPSTGRWRARRHFCEEYGGYSALCSCSAPFEFDDLDPERISREEIRIPILVLAGNRTRHLFHLLESLATQDRVTKEHILLVSDGINDKINRLASLLDLRIIIHRPEGRDATRISRNLRFALFNGLRQFPNATSLILLEDDLVLAPDFYSFMTQTEPIFEMDRTVFCVNAFNHLSYPHTEFDPSLVYRVQSFPAYGWMMPRYVIEEIIPKWLPASFIHDWDYFVGSMLVRRDREVLVPDINRSYHWSTRGFHLGASYASESLFLSREMNQSPGVKMQPLERVTKEKYEEEMRDLLARSTPVAYAEKNHLDAVIQPGKVFTIYVSKREEEDVTSFRLVGEDLGIWSMDGRDHHNSAWRFHYRGAVVLVIGVPLSPYSSYMPEGHLILRGTKEDTNGDAEFFFRSSLKYPTHLESSASLPPFWGID